MYRNYIYYNYDDLNDEDLEAIEEQLEGEELEEFKKGNFQLISETGFREHAEEIVYVWGILEQRYSAYFDFDSWEDDLKEDYTCIELPSGTYYYLL